MPAQKITALTSLATPQPTMLLYAGLSPFGVTDDRKITANALFAEITANITDISVQFGDGAAAAVSAAGKGKIRYNNTTGTFQVSTNGAAYVNLGMSESTVVSTQFDKTSDTTLANITGLSVSVAAGKKYRFEAVLYTTSNVAGGVKFAIGGTATATAVIYEAVVWQTGQDVATGTQRATALATAVGDVTAVTTAYIRITGTITVSAAGTLTVQFAQNASNGSASSVLVGSTFTVNEIPT